MSSLESNSLYSHKDYFWFNTVGAKGKTSMLIYAKLRIASWIDPTVCVCVCACESVYRDRGMAGEMNDGSKWGLYNDHISLCLVTPTEHQLKQRDCLDRLESIGFSQSSKTNSAAISHTSWQRSQSRSFTTGFNNHWDKDPFLKAQRRDEWKSTPIDFWEKALWFGSAVNWGRWLCLYKWKITERAAVPVASAIKPGTLNKPRVTLTNNSYNIDRGENKGLADLRDE